MNSPSSVDVHTNEIWGDLEPIHLAKIKLQRATSSVNIICL